MPNSEESVEQSTLTPLSSVPVGSSVVIRKVIPTGHGLEGRLERVGFIPGTRVRVERRAPLGDPTVYELRGYRMGLRAESASLIQVEPVGDPGGAP